MPSDSPSLSTLRARIAADFSTHSHGDPSIANGLEYALVNVITGVAHSLYGRQDYMLKQLFDLTAEDSYLLRRAADYNLYLIAGHRSAGTAMFTGTDGAVVEKNSVWENDGLAFITTASGVVAGGSVEVAIRAVDVGAAQNLPAGETLTLTGSMDGIDPQATVVSLAGGADTESMARFKARFAERKARPPAGGNDHDYIAWAKQAHPDITRVWVIRNGNGPGTVRVLVMCDGLANPVPTAPILDAVFDYIDRPDVRPAGLKGFTVEAPALLSQAIAFTSLSPNTPAVQAAVQAELDDVFAREADLGETMYLHRIREAISSATGLVDYAIDLASNIVPTATQLPALGAVTWPGA